MVKAFCLSLAALVAVGCSVTSNLDTVKQSANDLIAPKAPDRELALNTRLDSFSTLPDSSTYLLNLNAKTSTWEKTIAEKASSSTGEFIEYLFGSIAESDSYEPRPFEISLLSTYLAMNHHLAGFPDLAAVEARKIIEREALIEQLMQKQTAVIEKQKDYDSGLGPEANVVTEIEYINGYPIKTIQSPEVTAIKSSYLNPFSTIVAGFTFEANGEPSLAVPAYRRALEINPSLSFVKGRIANLNRVSKRKSVVLLVIESGDIDRITEDKFNYETYTLLGYRSSGIKLPVLDKSASRALPRIWVNDQQLTSQATIDISAYLAKAIAEELPKYLAFATTKALIEIASQESLKRTLRPARQFDYGISQLAGSYALKKIFDRGGLDLSQWKALPSNITYGIVELERNMPYQIRVNNGGETTSLTIVPTKDYFVVNFRVGSNTISNKALASSDQMFPQYRDRIINAAAQRPQTTIGQLKCLTNTISTGIINADCSSK